MNIIENNRVQVFHDLSWNGLCHLVYARTGVKASR